jgi:hypothetical protein
MATRLWHVPVRVATGAYILNSGLSKQGVDDQHAAQLQGMAATAFPSLADMPAQQFVSILATAETALGAALLAIPVVTALLAGLGCWGSPLPSTASTSRGQACAWRAPSSPPSRASPSPRTAG